MFQRIIVSTNIAALVPRLSQFGAPVVVWEDPPEGNPKEYALDPDTFYVFAFSEIGEKTRKMIPFMAAHASETRNFLAYCCRPSGGFTAEELGDIILVSNTSVYGAVQQQCAKHLQLHAPAAQ